MKSEIKNPKPQINHKTQNRNSKQYDLEERTLLFSKNVIKLCKSIPRDLINRRLTDQLVRSGTSIGANYREANETDTKRDFKHKVRISKKEAKETIYWLKLLLESNTSNKKEIQLLISESLELMKILASIYQKARQ